MHGNFSVTVWFLINFMSFAEFGDFDTLAREATVQLYSKSFVNYVGYHSFYPLMNFSCPGNITKVSFITFNIARIYASLPSARFSMLSVDIVQKRPQRYFQIVTKDYADAEQSVIVNTTDSYRLYELTLNSSSQIQFDTNDVFGIRLPQTFLNPLHQVRGGLNQYTYFSDDEMFRRWTLNRGFNFPLVSMETGKSAFCMTHDSHSMFNDFPSIHTLIIIRQANLCWRISES